MRSPFQRGNGAVPVLLTESLEFPELTEGVVELGPPGLVAIGGDLSIPRLRLAYQSGIFPWSVNPVTWWSPHRRGIMELKDVHIGQTLRRILRQEQFRVTINKAFRNVMEGCATARERGNWISPEFIDAYTALHEAGHAHSVECWDEQGLAGGVYGVSFGGLFAAESMFYRASNASKVALVHLVRLLRENGFGLLDIQMVTPTTAAFGAVEISRRDYLARLKEALALPATFVSVAK